MKTRVSSKGQIVIPALVRSQLGIQEGDVLQIEPGEGCIVLRHAGTRARRARLRKDPASGLPVLSAGKDAPVLSSKTVADFLDDFS